MSVRLSVRLSPNLKIPSVCIPLECTRTEHYSLTLTSLYNIVQVCITLYKSVQHCTSMYKIVQVCTSMQLQTLQSYTYKSVQHCASLYNIVQVCTTLYKHVQNCTSMYKIVTKECMQLHKPACSYISCMQFVSLPAVT